MAGNTGSSPITVDHKRDGYGFVVHPQQLQRYREYANIYKEEEDERVGLWSNFLERQAGTAQSAFTKEGTRNTPPKEKPSLAGNDNVNGEFDSTEERAVPTHMPSADESGINSPLGQACVSEGDSDHNEHGMPDDPEEAVSDMTTVAAEAGEPEVQTWAQIRPSLGIIDQMMRLKNTKNSSSNEAAGRRAPHLHPIEDGILPEDSEDEFCEVERSDPAQGTTSGDVSTAVSDVAHGGPLELFFYWKDELEFLVRGGLPRALRGELWQAFVGVGARRSQGYYQSLLDTETNVSCLNDAETKVIKPHNSETEKWKAQIEKDLPRTFPGHPALDEDGRSALRRILTAYALHDPSVGYCQAMNFFAGLLLLMMPEENAFWTLIGIIDNCFIGYYTEEMIESQVDQLVLEEIMRERFPKLVNHMDYLGVEMAWVTGPWFLSIFVNILPWESVLRVWDVLLFDGNRVILFRITLALMELYGPALVTTQDVGDAVTLLQSLAGSTFDSSQLVLTACMGYQVVNEDRLQELRAKHTPTVLAAMAERSKGLHAWKDPQGLATKLSSFKHYCRSLLSVVNSRESSSDVHINGEPQLLESESENIDDFLSNLTAGPESDCVSDLERQVAWSKVDLCRLLEEKRSAVLRAEELETALMEMVEQDNRRLLTAKVEQLEKEVAELQLAFADKQEQERIVLQVLIRAEQEQKLTEDARLCAEQDVAVQKYAVHMLQEKYEETVILLAQMEKRAVMAETLLEATLQHQTSQVNAQSPSSPSPRASCSPASQDVPTRKISLLSRPFGIGWRDRNKIQVTVIEKNCGFESQKKHLMTKPGEPDARNCDIESQSLTAIRLQHAAIVVPQGNPNNMEAAGEVRVSTD